MGCRVKDSMKGMKNDSAVLRVPGKKIPGQKPTSIRKGKEHKCFPLCLWAYAVGTALTMETIFTHCEFSLLIS